MAAKNLKTSLSALFKRIIEESERNPEFASDLEFIFNIAGPAELSTSGVKKETKAAKSKRNPAVLDPFEIVSTQGMEVLENALEELDIDQLKDIIAQFGMNQDKLAMKWRKKEKCIERILEKTNARTTKGDAFRS